MERRSPTGIARQRETRTTNPAPHQSHAHKPTHRQPRKITSSMERRSPTGIARERETRTDDPAQRQSHGCEPTHRRPRRITGTWTAGLRPASRGSAKPAPTTPRPANLTAANPRIADREESRGNGAPVSDRHRAAARNPPQQPRPPPISRLRTHASPTAQNRVEHGALASSPGGGLRPASRGSAKPAPTTLRLTNLTAANPRIANRAESRGRPGAPVSDRHRAGARNPHRRRRASPLSALTRVPPPAARFPGC